MPYGKPDMMAQGKPDTRADAVLQVFMSTRPILSVPLKRWR